MVIDFCPSPFSRAKKQESEEEIIKTFIFVLGKRSTVDAVVEWSIFFYFLRDSVSFSTTKGEQVSLLFPLLEGKRPILWYNRGLEVEWMKEKSEMLLEEFDPNRQAIINPQDLHQPIEGFPKVVISCFSRVTFARLLENYEHEVITRTSMANFEVIVYGITIGDQQIAVFNAPVGAASCVGIIEDLIQFGMEKLVLFGTCGVLDQDIEATSIIIPTAALRDEGTSYHYLPVSDEVEVNKESLPLFQAFLDSHKVSYQKGKVWTTDAPYRETIDKMKRRMEAGAICVDMECSAVAALAAFRDFELCHFFYAADHLSEEKWDIRTLSSHEDLDSKDRIADLAIQFALLWEKAN